jgi:hypothetical protein
LTSYHPASDDQDIPIAKGRQRSASSRPARSDS